ncbi:MAG: hypothetical protein WCY30_00470 [Candidatus Neomarinimicrobiota bacterium]
MLSCLVVAIGTMGRVAVLVVGVRVTLAGVRARGSAGGSQVYVNNRDIL